MVSGNSHPNTLSGMAVRPPGQPSRCMVTGATGFIGSHLAEALLRNGRTVVGVDRRGLDDPSAAAHLGGMRDHPRWQLQRADIAVDDLTGLLTGVDTVFHLAAVAGVRSSWGTRFTDYAISNIVGTERLLSACEAARVRRLVLASSSSVYGRNVVANREDGPTRPQSPYAVSKLAAEQLCAAHTAHAGTTLTTIALRYFTVYGPRQRTDMAISRVLTAALTGTPFILYGDGSARRAFTYVDDVVRATIAAGGTDHPGGAVNIDGGTITSMRQVISLAEEITGRRVLLDHQPAAPGDVAVIIADSARAQQVLGYTPCVDFADGMRRQAAWMAASQLHRPTQFFDHIETPSC